MDIPCKIRAIAIDPSDEGAATAIIGVVPEAGLVYRVVDLHPLPPPPRHLLNRLLIRKQERIGYIAILPLKRLVRADIILVPARGSRRLVATWATRVTPVLLHMVVLLFYTLFQIVNFDEIVHQLLDVIHIFL